MKLYQFILCILPSLSTYHCIIILENSNLSKRSPTPYRSYIQFEDKREGVGYGYKFQVEGDHTDQETHWKKPKLEQTSAEEHNSYVPNNYEQQPSHTHHHIPKHENFYNTKEEDSNETELQPQLVFESNRGSIKHGQENQGTYENSLHGSKDHLQSFPNLFFPYHEHGNSASNSAPIRVSQIPIITKYVPVPVKYIPAPSIESSHPSRGNIKFVSAFNTASTQNEPVIIMKPNIEYSSASTSNFPVKYVMVPINQSPQASFETQPNTLYEEHAIKNVHHQYNPMYEEHVQKNAHHQSQHQQINTNIPIKYMVSSMKDSNKENEAVRFIRLMPQKQIGNSHESVKLNQQLNTQTSEKYYPESYEMNQDLQKGRLLKENSNNYREYLPNRLAHPVLDKNVQYHFKGNGNIPPKEGEPMYEYKTIQEEDYKNSHPSVEYEMLHLPELINKLPVNTVDLQQKYIPQTDTLQLQQNFMSHNNMPHDMRFIPVNNIQTSFEGNNQQHQGLISGFGHDLMPNVNFNFGASRRTTKTKNDKLKLKQKKIQYTREEVKNN